MPRIKLNKELNTLAFRSSIYQPHTKNTWIKYTVGVRIARI